MAGGQVRCGRCTQVFDARTELLDTPPAAAAGEAPAEAGTPSGAAPAGGAEAGAEADSGPSARDDGILFLSEDWRVEEAPPRRGRRLAWTAGAVGAALVLIGQVVHHYRAELAGDDVAGSWVRRAYALVGVEVVPRYDPTHYRIRDWVATAEQTGGRSTLLIRAEIENGGPAAMPQPHIFLALKDRRDAVVASRVFAPHEYRRTDRARSQIAPGATTTAELEVVDPGRDAYGFELDVCVPRAPGGVHCANDDVFR